MADADPPPSKRRLSALLAAAAVGGLLVPIAVIAIAMKSCSGATTSGTLHVRHSTDELRVRVSRCTADAIDLTAVLDTGGPGPIVTATLDPLDGPRLRVQLPALDLLVTTATCPGLRVSVRRSGQRTDGTQLLDGSAAAACETTTADGTPVRLDVEAWFRACGLAAP